MKLLLTNLREFGKFQLVKIGQIVDVKSHIQLHQYNFNGVDNT
ncbi:hypothetical protein OCV67_03130 [Porcipelethomonas ammoniilytica]|nr:hypothetical protein [Porcipelethomonas ammoniilytica]MCU6718928.1 hypothetical protein [Porcipelethomonas ammoniilytica]